MEVQFVNARNQQKRILLVVVCAFLLIVLLVKSTITIQVGENGVVFRTFGNGINVNEKPLGEGFHFVAPWNKVYVYSIKLKEKAEDMLVLSSNGLEIKVDVSAWFRPLPEKLPALVKEIAIDYEGTIVIPAMRSAARSVIGRYTPEEIYSTKRDAIQDEIFVETKRILEEKYIAVDRALIRSVVLPETIKKAIESKLEQEQLSLEYVFKLDKEKKEAERKRIAADGEAIANRIVSSSLTESLLRMRGIEATITLSESNNAKMVIIGGGKDGMPLILNH
jgi:regulator of protease activity HflC (stomatin/prohibitin superfamily)